MKPKQLEPALPAIGMVGLGIMGGAMAESLINIVAGGERAKGKELIVVETSTQALRPLNHSPRKPKVA